VTAWSSAGGAAAPAPPGPSLRAPTAKDAAEAAERTQAATATFNQYHHRLSGFVTALYATDGDYLSVMRTTFEGLPLLAQEAIARGLVAQATLLATVIAMARSSPESPASQALLRQLTGEMLARSLTKASTTMTAAASPLAVAVGVAAFGQAALALAISMRVPGVAPEASALYAATANGVVHCRNDDRNANVIPYQGDVQAALARADAMTVSFNVHEVTSNILMVLARGTRLADPYVNLAGTKPSFPALAEHAQDMLASRSEDSAFTRLELDDIMERLEAVAGAQLAYRTKQEGLERRSAEQNERRLAAPTFATTAASGGGDDFGSVGDDSEIFYDDEAAGAVCFAPHPAATKVLYACHKCQRSISPAGKIYCFAPDCTHGFAAEARQCRSCGLPVASHTICKQYACIKRGGGFASPPDWDTPTALKIRKWRKEDLPGDREISTTGWHPCATGGSGAWDGPWLNGPPDWTFRR
jgi:hypothetical protein